MSETLHPVIQMAFGTKDGSKKAISSSKSSFNKFLFERALSQSDLTYITSVPPEYIQEFTYISGGGADKFTITFLDYSFGELEKKIMSVDRYKNNVYVRWGYPNHGLSDLPWHIMSIQNYQPTINHSGLRMTLSGYAEGCEYSTIVEPRTYMGKISDVVRQIAYELGFKDENIFIEDTDDSYRLTTKDEWSTSGRTRIDLINNFLINKAKSVQNPQGTYKLHLSSSGTFHFHTQFFKKAIEAIRGQLGNYREFNVLYGTPTNVIEFIPNYNSSSLGTFASSAIAAVYDPRTKQLQQTLIDRKTQGMSTIFDPKRPRTPAAPLTDSDDSLTQRKKVNAYVSRPVKQVALGGHCSGRQIQKHTGPRDAVNEIETAWKQLHQSVLTATLTVLGLPEIIDFTAREQYCKVRVVLPQLENDKGSDLSHRLHWSSGLYHIEEVTHNIAGGTYTITAQLNRMTATEGADDAKTGAPKEKKATLTSTAR